MCESNSMIGLSFAWQDFLALFLFLILEKFPLSTRGERATSIVHTVKSNSVTLQQPLLASLHSTRMRASAKYLTCLPLIFDLLVNLHLLQPSPSLVLNRNFMWKLFLSVFYMLFCHKCFRKHLTDCP